MGGITRFGVSLERDLLAAFDQLCRERSYTSRSEAIRDLVRASISAEQWGRTGSGSGSLTLIYDHHKHDLARRLMKIQHDHHAIIVATLHVHLDHDNCLEMLALKGGAMEVRELAQSLISCRGVKYGVFNPAPEGKEMP